MEDVAYRKE